MKKACLLPVALLLLSPVYSQISRKPAFRIMAGPSLIARTHLRNYSYDGGPRATYSLHEKPMVSYNFSAIVSFFLAKNWRLNTGVALDEKGYVAEGVSPAPTDGLMNFRYRYTAGYLGIPLTIETKLLNTPGFSAAVDAGFVQQWRVYGTEYGKYFLPGQFSATAGFLLQAPRLSKNWFVRPAFAYGITQLQDPLIGGPSPNFNAINYHLSIGYSW